MKKILSIILALVMSQRVFAEKEKIGELYYYVDESTHTAEVARSNEYSGDIVIPDTVINCFYNVADSVFNCIGYRVTSIGDDAFWNCTSLISVTIPNSVICIGERAFAGSGIEYAYVPDNVNVIKTSAFKGCLKLKEIRLPEQLPIIEEELFAFDSTLTSITIPNSVTRIGSGAFNSCTDLTSITIPNSVTSIGLGAFYSCKSLTSIIIPISVTRIEGGAFNGCESLTSIVIPPSVTSVEPQTFFYCRNLISVEIPNSVTSIGKSAFRHCHRLTSITIPNSVTNIGERAFEWCTSLQDIHYPEGIDLSKANIPITTKLIAYKSNSKQKLNISQSRPPLLALVNNSLTFTEPSNNNIIEAGEKCYIRFKIVNNGKGDATNCEARIKISGTTSGISAHTIKLPIIVAGQTYEANIPVEANNNIQNGRAIFTIEVNEPNGWGVSPFNLAVSTKAYTAPYVKVVDYATTSPVGEIRKMTPFKLIFNLQNIQYGDAEEVKVNIKLPAGVLNMDEQNEFRFSKIKSGEAVPITLNLIANNNLTTTSIPIYIDVQEKYGQYSENKQIDLVLNQLTTTTVIVGKPDKQQPTNQDIQLAMINSEVDTNIPETTASNDNTFVLIFANEDYRYVDPVPFAKNDGKIFRQYCLKTLGIPSNNIHYIENASLGIIHRQVIWLKDVSEAYDGDVSLIVYYAGHGIPDEISKTAYLLPTDGDSRIAQSAYKLDDLYQKLGSMQAKHILVFMDACFSGSKRGGGMLASTRGVALKAKSGVPQGNMIVFSAASEDETAYPNKEEQHGLFTYYLLKKLQETKGNVSLKELGNYITTNVRQQSIVKNGKAQTPTIIPSASLTADWQTWTLK